ncbi:MAG: formylglycine-generating enzyme family protein [Proteobacteria bacterium]|nr:formylglycine-generating enzyme family protein [Pseudomonadota bacterium]
MQKATANTLYWVVLFVSFALIACEECKNSTDCAPGEVCLNYMCETQTGRDSDTDTDIDSDIDDDSDTDTGSGSNSDADTDTDADSDTSTDVDSDTGTDLGECVDGDTFSGKAGITWVWVCGGTFDMGSNDGFDDEKPVHSVTVQSFQMTKTEVTFPQYKECHDAGVCTTANTGFGCNWNNPDYENAALNCASWQQSIDFCTWAGGRLPTEAEWEYAARNGGDNITHPWGEEESSCDYTVMLDCEGDTLEPCSKPQGNTAQEICDMIGSMAEWVQDWYRENYDGAPTDGSAVDTESSDVGRVTRGGHTEEADSERLRSTSRSSQYQGHATNVEGIRCVR